MRLFNLMPILLIFTMTALVGCASGVKEKVDATKALTPEINYSAFPEDRKYTAWSDQGDHLEELAVNGKIVEAAKLYEELADTYFNKKNGFKKETNKEVYSAYLDYIAKALNDDMRAEVNDLYLTLSNFDTWPAEENEWELIRDTNKKALALVEKYNDFLILKDQDRRMQEVDSLENKLYEVKDKLVDNLDNSFQEYGVSRDKDFFTSYPLEVREKGKFLSENDDYIINEINNANCIEIEKFYTIYSDDLFEELSVEISNIYFEKYIKEMLPSGESISLEYIFNSLQEVKEKGFDVHEIDKQNILFVEAINDSQLEPDYGDFPIEVDVDLPVLCTKCELDDLSKAATESNVVVFFDVAQTSIKRRIKSKETVDSKYLAGYRQVYNPDYNQTVINVNEAQRGLVQAQNTNCGTGLPSIACNVLKIAAVSGWRNRLDEANREYANTPEYIDEEIHNNYSFFKNTIELTKNAKVDYFIINKNKNTFLKSSLNLTENEEFDVAYNVHEKDTRSYYIGNLYSSEPDVEDFEKKPIKIKATSLLDDYFEHKNDLIAYKNADEIKKELMKNKNLKLASAKTDKIDFASKKDKRFENVVVVRNPKGSLGSGFYVDTNLVITNYHVVEGAKFVEMKLYNGLETFGKVIKSDLRLDLALIKVEANGEPVRFFESNQIALGEQVEAIGHPHGLEFSVTRGIVSAIRQQKSIYDTGGKDISFIQTDTAINPGNSGGPLFYKDRVVGVNNFKMASEELEGLGFAIHHSEIKTFLTESY